MAFCECCHLVNLPAHQMCAGCGLCFDCCACQEKAEILNLEEEHPDASCIPAGDVDPDEEEIEG
jgi:hypothetical protein